MFRVTCFCGLEGFPGIIQSLFVRLCVAHQTWNLIGHAGNRCPKKLMGETGACLWDCRQIPVERGYLIWMKNGVGNTLSLSNHGGRAGKGLPDITNPQQIYSMCPVPLRNITARSARNKKQGRVPTGHNPWKTDLPCLPQYTEGMGHDWLIGEPLHDNRWQSLETYLNCCSFTPAGSMLALVNPRLLGIEREQRMTQLFYALHNVWYNFWYNRIYLFLIWFGNFIGCIF